MEAMKKQAESTNTEYDRLLVEHCKLQVLMPRDVSSHKTGTHKVAYYSIRYFRFKAL